MNHKHIVFFLIVHALLLTFTLSAQATPGDIQALKDVYDRDHPGKGKFGQHWAPIPIQQYWNPKNFYKPPAAIQGEQSREDCMVCHEAIAPGAFRAWKNSVHANLDKIRSLENAEDARYYKKQELEKIENNLRRQGLLAEGQRLEQVSCIDCHGGVGAQTVDHGSRLVMPDRASCGTCHVSQFAEAESEKDQQWPQGQWPKGHPSHAVDWEANVTTAIWAGMPEREIAQGCDMCHYQQNKCDGCHTRHSFSAAEARQPEACATCHNGVDHNEYENYQLSKHGVIYQTSGKAKWNFEAPLKDALTKGGYTAPTCQYCHFEFNGEFSHNLVRKVRWGFNPTPEIADHLDHPWFRERKLAWQKTCENCHSARFAESYLATADKGTIAGIKVERDAKQVVVDLYRDGLLPGQKTNRPVPPVPEKDAPGGFFQLFWAKGNNPSHVERVHADMWEHDLIKLYKGLVHANPGGFTYTEGWSELLKDYTMIMDENTQLRSAQAKQEKTVQQPSSVRQSFINELRNRYVLGFLLAGAGVMVWWRRRR